MVNHFPNFVCWKDVFDAYDARRDSLYIDSVSCYILGLFLGVKGVYYSGPEMAHQIAKHGIKDYFFLLAEDVPSIPVLQKIVLPFKQDFYGDAGLLDFMKTVPVGANIIIGVSSPKQNILANYLFSLRDDLDYFCLGAAVKQTWGFRNANSRLRGTGFQWLEFLLFQPKRTVEKQWRTIIEATKIIVSPSQIKMFREFVTKSRHNK